MFYNLAITGPTKVHGCSRLLIGMKKPCHPLPPKILEIPASNTNAISTGPS